MRLSSKARSHPIHLVAMIVVGLMLAACNGGGGSTSYTVDTSVTGGGTIDPTSVLVAEGDTTSFTVTPDVGYEIDSVSGCGGTLSGSTFTTGAITADCTVSAVFVLPTLSVADTAVFEGDSGTATLVFTVTLSAQANGDVTVDYATGDDTATTADSDYVGASGTLTINSGTTSNTVSVTVNGDTTVEESEYLTLTLSNLSANAKLGSGSASGTVVTDDISATLNDTGSTLCGDYRTDGLGNNDLDCAAVGATTTVDGTDSDGDPVPAGQDALYGRDVTANDDLDGHAGFSFTKIDSAGNPLPASATSWDCVRDNVTGLMWEVKTSDSGLRDASWTYTWYNSDNDTNGGDAGTANGGTCYDTSNCDTEKFVAQVNGSGGICGNTDWRMPTVDELSGLMDLGATTVPLFDTAYFPNIPTPTPTIPTTAIFWSSLANASDSRRAWYVDFRTSYVGSGYFTKSDDNVVRLVR